MWLAEPALQVGIELPDLSKFGKDPPGLQQIIKNWSQTFHAWSSIFRMIWQILKGLLDCFDPFLTFPACF